MADRSSPSGTYRNIPGETTRGPTGTDDDRSSSSSSRSRDMDQTSPSGTYQNIPEEPTKPTPESEPESEPDPDRSDERESPRRLTTSPSGTYRNIPGETTRGPTGAGPDERRPGPTTSPSGTYRNIPGETTRGPARSGDDETQRAYSRELGDRLEPRLRLGEIDPETQDPTTPESRAAIERSLGLGSTPDTAPSTARYGATPGATPTVLDADDVYVEDGEYGLTAEGARSVEEAAGRRVAATTDAPFGSEDYSTTLSTGGGITVEVTDEAHSRELLEQLREENPDLDIQRDDVEFEETDGGALRAEFVGEVDDGPPTREGFLGSRLQSASNWWQSGAETVGETVEDATPGADVTLYTFASGGRSVPLETGEQADEVLGGASETILSGLDPAGAALAGRDLTVALSNEYEGWQDYRYEQSTSQPLSPRDLIDRPGTVADAVTGAGYLEERGTAATLAARESAPEAGRAFVQRPTESALGGTGTVLAGFGAGTAAVRGARQLGRLDFDEPRLLTPGRDRGQMDLTITRTRDADDVPLRDQPADPTAPTPEGRTPPREAFPSDEAYQAALQRREEEIVRELLDDTPSSPSVEGGPVDRVRSLRDEFDSRAEYQRELREARRLEREGMGQQTPFAPAGLPAAQREMGAEAFAGDQTATLDSGAFGEFGLEAEAEAGALLDAETGLQPFAEATAQETGQTTAQELTTDFTTTRTVSPQLTRTTTMTPQRTVTRTTFTSGGASAGTVPRFWGDDEDGLEDMSAGGSGERDDLWQTGFADPEDVLAGFDDGGSDRGGWF